MAYGRFDVPAEVFDQVMSTNVIGTANVRARLWEPSGSSEVAI